MLKYNELAYKKTNNHCKLEDRFQKKAISQSNICEFADKKTAYNKGRLYGKSRLLWSLCFQAFVIILTEWFNDNNKLVFIK